MCEAPSTVPQCFINNTYIYTVYSIVTLMLQQVYYRDNTTVLDVSYNHICLNPHRKLTLIVWIVSFVSDPVDVFVSVIL